MKKISFILLITALYTPIFSQVATNRKNYSDMKNIESIAVSDKAILGATDGGGFFYDIPDNSFKTFHKTDGLNGVSLTSVTIDKFGKVWFGSSSGIIDIYNPETNDFKTILDIYNSDKSSKKINGLSSSGDTIVVSTDFGISLINADNYLFFDTFFKFGNFPANIKVNNSLKTAVLYAGTEQGAAIQKVGATNLSAPESWNVYTTANGLPSNNVTKIVSFNNSIIAATAAGLASFNGTSWLSFIPELNNVFINDIFPKGDSLLIVANNNNIFLYQNSSLTQLSLSQNYNISTINYSPSEGILVGTNKGILKLNDNTFIYPNGPYANLFPSMTVDANENLWSASGTDVSGEGYYKFDGTNWFNYNTSNTSELPTNAYHTVYVSPDNTIYLGNWGNGFITISPDGTITNYNRQNTGMQGIETNADFLVIDGFGTDTKNNLWVLNYGATDHKILSMENTQGQWTHFSIPQTGSQYVDQFFNLAIDQYNTKWFCSQSQDSRQGLYFFNEGNSISSSQDDVSGFLGSPDINNNFVSSIQVDRRGDVWVGTSLGVNIISNTYSILTGSPQLVITSVFSLRQQTVTALAVDPLNQKWVGTNQGLILVNSDGTSLLATLNTTNSPLPSDLITSLAIDENTGTVYVGTDKGLTSFVTTAVKPKEAFDELTIYPNPLLLNGNNNLVTIDGLIRDTDIKILTISGKLIKAYSSPGGRVAIWDGRDDFGKLVPSGVYFIVAFDKEGNSVAKAKIAVLREN
jgi:ligand-binding sensor domain-containing protein